MVPAAEMCGKLRAAVDARQSRETLILARTDALPRRDAALIAERYLEAGADALFIEALRSGEQMRAAAGGCRPRRCWPTWSRAARRRCKARRSWPRWDSASSSSRRARRAPPTRWRATTAACASTAPRAPWRDRMLDFDGLNAMIGTPELLAAGKRYEA